MCTSCVNGVGYQERSRNCSCPQPLNGGFDCTASGESNTTFTTFEGISMETKRLSCNNCSRSESIQNKVYLEKIIREHFLQLKKQIAKLFFSIFELMIN